MKEEDIKGPMELKELQDLRDYKDGENNKDIGEGSEFEKEKLREYQLNRLKYYYAVVECDSQITANTIYEECDGMEYEMSGTRLDIRFVPDDTLFEHEPKSVATEMPAVSNYQPTQFLNTALQQSTVRLTWDETDIRRMQATSKQFSKDDLETMDFKDYIASSSDEDVDESSSDKIINKSGINSGDIKSMQNKDKADSVEKYRAILDVINKEEKEDEDDGDMEVIWEPGMNAIRKNNIENRTIEVGHNNKKKGNIKRAIQKENIKENQDSANVDVQSSSGDSENSKSGFNDPFFTADVVNGVEECKRKREKKKMKQKINDSLKVHMTEEEKKSNNSLELLLMDEDEDRKHFNMKTILGNEKLTKKKKRKKMTDKKRIEDSFQVDVKDKRFSAIYNSHLYALDPSEPHFKKTKAVEAILAESQKRREQQIEMDKINKHQIATGTSIQHHSKTDLSLTSLVKSVKDKAKTHKSKNCAKTR